MTNAGGNVVGVVLTPAGEAAVRLLDPTTAEYVHKVVEANVLEVFVERFGSPGKWSQAVRLQYEDQVDEAVRGRSVVVSALGRRFVKVAPEE